MDCSRRRTLELGLGAVGSLTLLAGCSDEGAGGGNDSEENASDEQADHPDEVGEDMEDEAEPTGFAPEENESESDDENATAGPEQDEDEDG